MGNTKYTGLAIILFVFFCSIHSVFSQTESDDSFLYDIELVSDLSGVYSRAVNFSYQDAKGNIWVSTRDGLFLFDGVNAVRVDVGFDMTDALFWRSMVEDSEGRIWIHLFDSITSKNKLVVLEEVYLNSWRCINVIDKLPSNIKSFKELQRAPRLGVFLLNKDGTVNNIQFNSAAANIVLLDSHFIDDYESLVSMTTFDEGSILLYKNGKIKYWDLYNDMRFIIHETDEFIDGWINQNSDGDFVLLTLRQTAKGYEFERLHLSLEEGVLEKRLMLQKDMKLFKKLDELNVIFCNIRNHYYIVNSYYLYTFPDIKSVPSPIVKKMEDLARGKGLAHINQIDEKTLILSSNSGLFVCKFQKQQFKNYNSVDSKGALNSSIRRFIPLDSSTLLVDGYQGHYLINLKNGLIENSHPFLDKLYTDFGKKRNDFLQVFKVNDSKLILKARPRLFVIYDNESRSFEEVQLLDIDPNFGAELWDVHYVNEDLCFIASSSGLLKFSLRDNTITGFDKSLYHRYQELTNSITYQIKEIGKGEFLLASTSGLYRFHPTEGVKEKYKRENNDVSIYLDDQIHFIHQVNSDEFYLGTNSEGLIKYSLSEGIIETISKINGRDIGAVHFIYVTEDGKIWMSTNEKLILLEDTTGRNKSFYIYEGVKVKEFNRQAYYVSTDNQLFLGGINGGISFYPERIDIGIYNDEHKVRINTLDWFDINERSYKNVDISDDQEVLSLSSFQNSLRLKCSVVLFGKGAVNYYYRLTSSSEEYILSNNNNINIDLLRYGQDTLQIFGEFNFEGERTDLLSLPIYLAKPFYRKNIFFFLIGALLIFVFYVYTSIREKNSIMMRKRLEAVVHERTQQNLAQAEELMEVNKLKDRFFINISHELKTPLSLIKGPLEKLSNRDSVEKEDAILMDMVMENVSLLSSLIKDILDLSKLELGKQEVELTEFDLVDFFENRLNQFRLRFDSLNVKLIKEFENEIIYGAFDKKMMYTILSNLIDNCLNHATGLTHIKVFIEQQDNNVVIRIQDNGNGIPKHKLKLLFDRFHTVSNKRGGASLGIGLAISKEFAKLMGGDLSVDSEEKVGTTFTLIVPIIKVQENINISKEFEERIEAIQETPLDLNTVSSNISSDVLIVEDNKQLALFIDLLLKDKYRTVVKHNGLEAWEYLNSTDVKLPQLIISDIMMPEMDGFELLENIRKSEALKHVSFLFLTARDGKKDILRAMRIGVEDYLSKPFLEAELLTIVDNLLRNYLIRSKSNVQELALADEKEELKYDEIEVSDELPLADKEFLEQFDKYISEHLGKMEFTIETLSYDLAISSRQLRRKVQKLTGLTPNQYVRNYKMNVARDLLENREVYSVKELSYKLGFKSSAHFAKLFKAHFGRNPSDFV